MSGAYDVVFRSAKPMRGFGTTEIRCMQPMRFLQEAGFSAHSGSVYDDDLPPCQLLVLHRVSWDAVTQNVIELARSYGASILYDTDDFLAGPNGTDWDPDIAAAMRAADLVSVSGNALAAKVAELGHDTIVIRAKLSRMLVSAAAQATVAERPRDQIVIGYFSGSAHHDADFELVAPALAQVLRDHPHTRLALGGKLNVGPEFDALKDRVSFAPFRPYAEFVQLLGKIDINLAPLDLNALLAQSRSDLKYIEASAFGVPTIASPSRAYLDAIEDGRTGLIAADHEWRDKLEQLICAPDRRRDMGAAARSYVTDAVSPAAGCAEWADLFVRLKPASTRGKNWSNLPLRCGLSLARFRRNGRRALREVLCSLSVGRGDATAGR